MKTHPLPQIQIPTAHGAAQHSERNDIERPYDVPDSSSPFEEPDEPSDVDNFDSSYDDDTRWDVFIPDDDESDPQPDPRDFDGNMELGAWSDEPD